MANQEDYEAERRAMIEGQLRRRGLRDERVLDVVFRVPRHEFVPPAYIDEAYSDRPLPIGEQETISQPYIVAAMTIALGIKLGDRALEIGTGTGYQAAVLAQMGARVWSVERNPRLAEEARERLARLGYQAIEVILGDGTEGYAPAAPYQAIVVTAGAPVIPNPLLNQLADGGRMVIPVGDLQRQTLHLILKNQNQLTDRILDPCQFVPLVGKHAWPEKKGPVAPDAVS
jgi:protein-L-isoaspartate(D-aspartate) O-methyltransferase